MQKTAKRKYSTKLAFHLLLLQKICTDEQWQAQVTPPSRGGSRPAGNSEIGGIA